MSSIISYGSVAESMRTIHQLQVDLHKAKEKLENELASSRTSTTLDSNLCKSLNDRITKEVTAGSTYFSLKVYTGSSYVKLTATMKAELSKVGWDLYSSSEGIDSTGCDYLKVFIRAINPEKDRLN